MSAVDARVETRASGSEGGRAPSFGLALHVAAVVAALFALDPRVTTLERYALVKEALLALVAIGLCVLGLARRRPWRLDAIDALLVSIVAIDLAHVPFAIDTDVARRGALVTAILAALARDLRGRSAASRARLAAWALGLTTVAASLVVMEAYGLVPRISLPSYAPGTTIGQRNNAGHVIAIALVVALAAYARAGSRRILWALAPLACALVLTRSRVAWWALAIGIALGALSWREVRTMARAGVAALVASLGAVAPLVLRPVLSWRIESPYADSAARMLDVTHGSGLGRLTQGWTSLAIVRAHPLGVGAGHWALFYPSVASSGDPTIHREAWAPLSRSCTSDLVGSLVERGIPGAALLLVLSVLVARESWRSDRVRAAGLAALGVVATLDCLTSLATGAVALALLLPAREQGEPTLRAASAGARAVQVVAATALALGLAGAPRAIERVQIAHAAEAASLATTRALVARDPWNVPLRARLVDHAMFTSGCAEARPWLDEILRLRPYLPRARSERAGCTAPLAARRAPEPDARGTEGMLPRADGIF
ncbi:MAG: O-antigen ligase family protein [Sandaracinus sp.]